MFDFLSKLSFNRGTRVGFIIFGILIAPYWFLFQFYPNIYEKNELVKLILLSISIGAPIALFDFSFLLVEYATKNKHNPDQPEAEKVDAMFNLIGGACLFTAITLYVPCVVSFFEEHLNPKHAIYFSISLQLGLLTSSIFDTIDHNRKRKKAIRLQSDQEKKG
jgi:hypothetical protein